MDWYYWRKRFTINWQLVANWVANLMNISGHCCELTKHASNKSYINCSMNVLHRRPYLDGPSRRRTTIRGHFIEWLPQDTHRRGLQYVYDYNDWEEWKWIWLYLALMFLRIVKLMFLSKHYYDNGTINVNTLKGWRVEGIGSEFLCLLFAYCVMMTEMGYQLKKSSYIELAVVFSSLVAYSGCPGLLIAAHGSHRFPQPASVSPWLS